MDLKTDMEEEQTNERPIIIDPETEDLLECLFGLQPHVYEDG